MRRLKLLALAVALAVPLAACDEGGGGVEVVTGTIQGSVTVDGAGQQGVAVTLSGGTEGQRSTTTDASGGYSFQNVEAGSYVVSISGVPSDVSFPSTSKAAVVSSSSQSVTVNFSGMRIATSSIVGSVTASGSALSGVTVTVSGSGSGSDETDADGQYAITGLVAGSYTVTISGFDASKYNFSSASKSANVGVGETAVVSFQGSEAATGTLTVTVTVDGQGRSGVAASITGPADRSGTTGANGQAVFNNLPRGAYSVSITNPDPSNISFDRTNTSATISEIGGSATASFEGSTITNASISGRVYVDLNKNGTFDSGTDMPFDGLTVSLSGAATTTATTASDGTYSFGMLAAGSYTASVTNPDPSAYTFDQTSQNFTLTASQAATANFRAIERRDGSIGGRVWFDNGDGVFTSVDEPAANFSISISGPEAKTTTTSSTGQFSFSGLLLGEYEVTCDNCDATFAPTSPVTVNLTASAPTASQDFVSEQGQGTISGQLYIDGNENNTLDPNVDAEYPLAGVKITLEGPEVGQTTSLDTDADGRYSFGNLRPGNYNVSIDDTDADITDPVALGTTKNVTGVNIQSGTSQVVNFGFDITTWIVKVPVVYGTDGKNETPASGVGVTAWAKRDLTTALDVQNTGADGYATLSISRAAETSIAGGRDNIIYTQPTSFNAEASINSEPQIEYHLDANLFVQTIPEDHNLIWNQVFITGTYVERSGSGVPDGNVASLGLNARLGVGTKTDGSDRTFLGASDVPNDDLRADGSAMTEAVGQYTFKTTIPKAGGNVFSVQDASGSAQIIATGNADPDADGDATGDNMVTATVDGSMRTVTMPNLLITYPTPNLLGRVWHEANDQIGYQTTGTEKDDLLNLGNGIVTIQALYDDNADGNLEAHGCAITAATGSFTCQDVPATADPVHLFGFKANGTAVRLIPEGSQSFTVVDWDVAGADLTVDVSPVVDDSKLRIDLGNEPFSYKFTGNTVKVTVFNEAGAGLDGDGVPDGGEVGVRGVRVQIQPTSGTSLGTLANEFPKVVTTDGTGVATFSNAFEGEYEARVVGVSTAAGTGFTAGLNNLRTVQYDASGNAIFTEAPTDVLIGEYDLQRTAGPATVNRSIEAQYRGGTIGGLVFDNDDDDLIIDPNEFLSNEVVELVGDLDFDGVVDNFVGSSTTGSNAQYLFEDLWEGTYDLEPQNAGADPSDREGLMLVEADNVGTVIPVSGAGEYDPDVDIDNGDGAVATPGATGEARLVMNADADDDSDLDFEIVFANTQIQLTVVDDAGDPIPNVTVSLDRCGFATSIEGHDADNKANNDGDCTSPSLVTTKTTDASGVVTFTDLQEGFWRVDPKETTASAGYVNDEDDENFWVIRTNHAGDSEARTAQITIP